MQCPVLTYPTVLFDYELAVVVFCAVGLRVCYAMPGADIASAAALTPARARTLHQPQLPLGTISPICLRARHAMSRT
eukprot:1460138-Rhodomonas_salina.2